MATTRRTKRQKPRRLRVGDRVSFTFGLDRVVGTVIEDRGNIGFRGRRLLRIRVRRRDTEDLVIELPAEELGAA